jgi:RNA polymerase sigma-70 factor (family 1)
MLANESYLLKQCSLGDDHAFSSLYTFYSPIVYRFIFRFVKSTELADDLTQEVFIKVLDHRKDLNIIQSFKSYLFTISRNHTFNLLKRASLDSVAKGLILSNYIQESSLEDELATKEYLNYLDKILSTLSPQTRAVFILCRQQNKSYDEAAEILGVSRNAIKKHMIKSMKILGDAVQKDLGLPLSVFLVLISK